MLPTHFLLLFNLNNVKYSYLILFSLYLWIVRCGAALERMKLLNTNSVGGYR